MATKVPSHQYEHLLVCDVCGELRIVRSVDRHSMLAHDYKANHEWRHWGRHHVTIKTQKVGAGDGTRG